MNQESLLNENYKINYSMSDSKDVPMESLKTMADPIVLKISQGKVFNIPYSSTSTIEKSNSSKKIVEVSKEVLRCSKRIKKNITIKTYADNTKVDAIEEHNHFNLINGNNLAKNKSRSLKKKNFTSKKTKKSVTDDNVTDNAEGLISSGNICKIIQKPIVDGNMEILPSNLNFKPKNEESTMKESILLKNNIQDTKKIAYLDILNSMKLKKKPIIMLKRLKISELRLTDNGSIDLRPKNYETTNKNVNDKSQISETTDKVLNLNQHIHELVSDINEPAKLTKVKNSNDIAQCELSSDRNLNDKSCNKPKRKPKKYSTIRKKHCAMGNRNTKESKNTNKIGTSLNIGSEDQISNSETKNIFITKKNIKDSTPLKELEVVSDIAVAKSPEINSSESTLLQTEINLLDYVHELCLSLKINSFNYCNAMKSLEKINTLKLTAQLIKKHSNIANIIKKITTFIGSKNISELSEQEAINYSTISFNIRCQARKVLNTFASLFTVPDGKTFKEVFGEDYKHYIMMSNNLSLDNIYISSTDLIED